VQLKWDEVWKFAQIQAQRVRVRSRAAAKDLSPWRKPWGDIGTED
jgi:hypothetical protein